MIIELAEQILASITASLTTLKDGSAYDIVNVLTPEFALDPIIFLEKGKEGIFVMPITSEIDINASQGRGQKKVIAVKPIISVNIVSRFRTPSTTDDVGSIPEIKAIMAFRERLDLHLARTAWLQNIFEIMPSPPMELKLDERAFFSITELTFEGVSC